MNKINGHNSTPTFVRELLIYVIFWQENSYFLALENCVFIARHWINYFHTYFVKNNLYTRIDRFVNACITLICCLFLIVLFSSFFSYLLAYSFMSLSQRCLAYRVLSFIFLLVVSCFKILLKTTRKRGYKFWEQITFGSFALEGSLSLFHLCCRCFYHCCCCCSLFVSFAVFSSLFSDVGPEAEDRGP